MTPGALARPRALPPSVPPPARAVRPSAPLPRLAAPALLATPAGRPLALAGGVSRPRFSPSRPVLPRLGGWELLAAVERTRVAAGLGRVVAPLVRAGPRGPRADRAASGGGSRCSPPAALAAAGLAARRVPVSA